MDFNLELGISAKIEQIVEDKDTAKSIGSGLPEVFSTPSMIALMEITAFRAVQPHLPKGYSAVGTYLDVKHLAATPVGMKVWAEATLVGVDRKRLSFKINAYDEKEKIGEADHNRFIIDVDKFTKKTYEKANA